MDANELKKLRDEASATIARIDKALAGMAEKPTPERPFRRGEPVLVWDDPRNKFLRIFVGTENNQFVISNDPRLLNPQTYTHCVHLPPSIDWDLIDEVYWWASEYDSGLVTARGTRPEIGAKNALGTIVAVHKRPEEDK